MRGPAPGAVLLVVLPNSKVGVEVAPKVVKVVGQTILSRMRLNAEVCDPTTVAQGRVMTLLPTFDLLAPTASLMSSFATKKFGDSLYTELHDVTPSLESLRTCAEKVLKAGDYTFLNAYFQYPSQNSLANAPRGTHVQRMKQTAAKASNPFPMLAQNFEYRSSITGAQACSARGRLP